MINILLNNDYPLKGNLNYFEAYMFATTERHIAKHYIMKGNIHLFDGSKDEEKIYSMDELETRKKALKEFNMGIMLSHIMLAAEEYWMNMETLVEEQFAKKDYKNGEYVCTIVFHS